MKKNKDKNDGTNPNEVTLTGVKKVGVKTDYIQEEGEIRYSLSLSLALGSDEAEGIMELFSLARSLYIKVGVDAFQPALPLDKEPLTVEEIEREGAKAEEIPVA